MGAEGLTDFILPAVTATLHVGLRSGLRQVDNGVYELPSVSRIITWQRM